MVELHWNTSSVHRTEGRARSSVGEERTGSTLTVVVGRVEGAGSHHPKLSSALTVVPLLVRVALLAPALLLVVVLLTLALVLTAIVLVSAALLLLLLVAALRLLVGRVRLLAHLEELIHDEVCGEAQIDFCSSRSPRRIDDAGSA